MSAGDLLLAATGVAMCGVLGYLLGHVRGFAMGFEMGKVDAYLSHPELEHKAWEESRDNPHY